MTGTTSAQQFWEDFYRERPVWSGRPNVLLVREVEALPPGTALDLGCAEGADAVWLALRGWRVTGVDASSIALRRAAAHAAEAGVDVDWQCHDLSRTFPDGTYDLVCAQYLHTPDEVPGEREAILRRAAAAVAPGGLLLVIGHEKHERHPDVHLPSTGDVLTGLDLDPVGWRVELEDVVERVVTDPDGRPATRRDNVLRVRRTS
jgi:2-polyprenyl-3-methyl-5-hydroxy-6-metoxy-1,4-benzoquinol methylase